MLSDLILFSMTPLPFRTTLSRFLLPCIVSGALVFFLSGCSGYEIKNLAKTDIDLVTDEFVDESRYLVRS